MTVLKTARLTLREFETTDVAEVQEYASDERVAEFVEWGPNTLKETKDFLKRTIGHRKEVERRSFDFAIILEEESKLIGGCGIYVMNEVHKTGMIGYVLNAEYWHRGFASEAAAALLKFGFEKLELHRIYATCDAHNENSAKVMKKIGMRREGEFKQERFVKERWRDTLLYAVLIDEWRQ